MNSDQLLNALTDCAQASTHEPDAETINAAVEYIMQLERENHNQDLTIDEKNERIAQIEAQLVEARNVLINAEHKAFGAVEMGEGYSAAKEIRENAVNKVFEILGVERVCFGCGNVSGECVCGVE